MTGEALEAALEGVADLPATAVDAAGRVLAVTDEERLEEVAVEVLRRQGDRVIVAPGALACAAAACRTCDWVRPPLKIGTFRLRPITVLPSNAVMMSPDLMPARKAACSLPPMIFKCRPKGVLAMMKLSPPTK